ncbi:Zinc finger MYM-type protein 1 [Glycine soja]
MDDNFRDLIVDNGPIRYSFYYQKSHETSYEHVTNMDKWVELETGLGKKNTIYKEIPEQINMEKEHWEKVLVRIITIIKYLSKNNLSFHGTNEKIYQKYNGNFLSLIELLAEFDPIMQEHVKRIKNGDLHNHYLIKDAKYFSIILNCTPDVSHQEQMTLILRCVDTFSCPVKIEEYFFRVFPRTYSGIKKYDLDINDIRGQEYDNGSNMKGKNQGVQKRLLDINPRAYYTPCSCHNLNLVLGDMANSCTRAVSFFGVLQHIYSLFDSSTKRIGSVKAIKFQAPKIRDALVQLSKTNEDPKIKSEAICLATYEMENFEFLLGMNIWYDILFAVNSISMIMQSKDMNIDVAIDHLRGLITYLKNYRENGFASALESTKEMTIEMDIEPKYNEKHQSISFIESRFEQFLEYENMFGFLFDSNKFKTLSEDELKKYCINLEKNLSFEDHSGIDGLDLFL